MKKSKSIIAMVLAGIMMFTTACGTTGGNTGGNNGNGSTNTNVDNTNEDTKTLGDKILRTNSLGGEPGTLEPGLSQGTHESWILDHMFKGLYTKTPDGEPELAAASDVKVSDDGLTYTFTLKDFEWSTGNKGVANDFVQSFLFTLNPDNAAKYSSNLWILKNGEAYNKGTVDASEVGVRAIDDKTLEIELEMPIAYFPDLLTNTFFYPIDSVNAEANPKWYLSVENYSSNGPFTLYKWSPKEEIIIIKNDKYYDADKTMLDGVSFSFVDEQTTEWQMYELGQIDLVYALTGDVVESLKASGSTELTIANDLGTYYYYFNTEVAPFTNVKVRRALAMAIDRRVITENVTKGGQIPAYSLTSLGVPDETGEEFSESLGALFAEDLDEARTLLAEGLAEEGMDINTWSFNILYNTSDQHKLIAEAIQSMWSVNLGVNCSLENADFNTVLARRAAGDFDVARAGWLGDYADPMTYLDLFTSNSEFNDGNWKNDEYDALIDAALRNPDPVSRMQQLRDAETIFINDMGVIPIYFYTKQIAIKPEFTGIYTPINKYPNFEFAVKN